MHAIPFEERHRKSSENSNNVYAGSSLLNTVEEAQAEAEKVLCTPSLQFCYKAFDHMLWHASWNLCRTYPFLPATIDPPGACQQAGQSLEHMTGCVKWSPCTAQQVLILARK